MGAAVELHLGLGTAGLLAASAHMGFLSLLLPGVSGANSAGDEEWRCCG